MTLDPNPALVVIDLQKGITSIPTAHPMADVIARSALLAAAFRAKGFPVVLVNVDRAPKGRADIARPNYAPPPDWADLVPELHPQPGDLRVTKKSWGAFLSTDLDARLRQLGVTQIVLTGVATTAGVESTARSAHDLGYNVAFVADAMTDRDADAHRYSVEKLFPRIGEVTLTAPLLDLLK